MTAKEYLLQIRIAKSKIQRLQLKRQELREQMYLITSPKFDSDPVKTSTSGDGMLRLIARVDKLERDTIRQIEVLTDLIEKISKEIEALPNELQRTILFDYYVCGYTWELIAVNLNRSIRYVYKVRRKALKNFAMVHCSSVSEHDIN